GSDFWRSSSCWPGRWCSLQDSSRPSSGLRSRPAGLSVADCPSMRTRLGGGTPSSRGLPPPGERRVRPPPGRRPWPARVHDETTETTRKETPMSYGPIQIVLRFRSGEFSDWKRLLDEQEEIRTRHGALGHQISRSIDDPHDFLAVVPFASLGGAIGYCQDPDRFALKRAVFGKYALRSHEWDESIHELVDAGGYGYVSEEFGRAWSPVHHHLQLDAADDH